MEIEFGITAEQMMKEDFPIVDSSLTLEDCLKKMDSKFEACIIMHEGYFKSIVSYDDLVRTFFSRKRCNLELSEMRSSRNFAIVSPKTDVFKVISLMKKWDVDFIVVKDEHTLGLITKKEIAEINQTLFDRITPAT